MEIEIDNKGFEEIRKDKGMSPEEFYAYPQDPPSASKLPIYDADHVRNALARFSQTDLPSDKKSGVWRKIVAAAKKFNIEVSEKQMADINNADISYKLVNKKGFRDLENEVKIPFVVKDKILMSPGRWNNCNYSPDAIKKGFVHTDFFNAEVRNMFLDHEDDRVREWVGEIDNPRLIGDNVIGDLVFVDKSTAMKVAYGAKFGISPRVRAAMDNDDVEDYVFKNFSVVIGPAVKTAYINNSVNGGVTDVVIEPVIVEKEEIKKGHEIDNKEQDVIDNSENDILEAATLSFADDERDDFNIFYKNYACKKKDKRVIENIKNAINVWNLSKENFEFKEINNKEEGDKVEAKAEEPKIENKEPAVVAAPEVKVEPKAVEPKPIEEPKKTEPKIEVKEEKKVVSFNETEEYKTLLSKNAELENKIKELEAKQREKDEKLKVEVKTKEEIIKEQRETAKGISDRQPKKKVSDEEADENFGAIMNASMTGRNTSNKRWIK